MNRDAFQSSKITWLHTFVKVEHVRAPLQKFVEAQTSFAKQITSTWYDVTGAAAKAMTDKLFSTEGK